MVCFEAASLLSINFNQMEVSHMNVSALISAPPADVHCNIKYANRKTKNIKIHYNGSSENNRRRRGKCRGSRRNKPTV